MSRAARCNVVANVAIFGLFLGSVSAHSMGSMDDGDMSDDTTTNSTLMGMNSMAMVFFTSSTTPLYAWAWTPSSLGQYAGTCIFLIAFAAMFRALLALRTHYYDIVAAVRARKHGDKLLYRSHFNGEAAHEHHSWRAADAVQLASLDVVIAGVGYLL